MNRRLFAEERGARRRAWAQQSLDRFGIRIIIACRFIPGGRTAVTLTCGMIGYPRRRFRTGAAVAGIVWASYAFVLGRLGGKAFEHQPWIGLLLALGALAAGLLVFSGKDPAVRPLSPFTGVPVEALREVLAVKIDNVARPGRRPG